MALEGRALMQYLSLRTWGVQGQGLGTQSEVNSLCQHVIEEFACGKCAAGMPQANGRACCCKHMQDCG